MQSLFCNQYLSLIHISYKPTAVYEKDGDVCVTVPFQKQQLANDMAADTTCLLYTSFDYFFFSHNFFSLSVGEPYKKLHQIDNDCRAAYVDKHFEIILDVYKRQTGSHLLSIQAQIYPLHIRNPIKHCSGKQGLCSGTRSESHPD